MNKILNLGKVKLTMHKNGFPKGFVMKRKATLRECRYILYTLLGINICTREDFEFPEEYKEYNEELLNDVNDWLSGECDDDCISEYAYDCSDEPLGLHNMLIITNYLQKKGIIQWLYEKELENGFKCRGSFPAERTWENVKGFQYIYEDKLKLIGKKINELFEKKTM